MDNVINSVLDFDQSHISRKEESIIHDEESNVDNFDSFYEMERSNYQSMVDLNTTSIVDDCPDFRKELPILRDMSIKPAMLWNALKNLVGKDLSQQSFPVFINEPISTLQKAAEMVYLCDDLFQEAIKEKDSLRRLIYLATCNAATYFLIKGRTAKPFNPLLGETYELITPKYRFYSEQVCHHPPMLAINC